MQKGVNYIILFLALAQMARADAYEDFKKSFQTAFGYKNISFTVSVKMFNTLTDKKPQLQLQCYSIKKENNYFSSFMGKTTIFNFLTKELVEVNDRDKTITFSIIQEKTKPDTLLLPKSAKMSFQADTSFATNGLFTYLEKGPDVTVIEIKPPKSSPYKSVRISIDNKTYLFKKIEYFPRKQEEVNNYEHIVIDYSFDISGKVSDDVFKVNKYISRKGLEVKPKPSYAAYTIKNQMKPNKK